MNYQLYPAAYSGKNPPETLLDGGARIPVALDYADGAPRIDSNAWRLMDQYRLSPSPRAIELYRLAVMAYAADTRLPRKLAFNRWERDIVLHVPVAEVAPWQTAGEIVTDLLGFLTGDHWTLAFFPSSRARPGRDGALWRKGALPATDSVALFSGGLDSFIGAADLLAAGDRPVLVGHCDAPSTSKVQTTLATALRAKYGAAGPLLQFWINPPALIGDGKENTTRGRSFLFFALATLAATGLGRNARLIVPENGFIALNAPLTSMRLGALSTRTVHPYTVTRYRDLLGALGLSVSIETPYALATKGEMLEHAADQAFVREWADRSMSCAHPTAGRWQKLPSFKHCGRCVPCLIRRAAFHHVGLDNPSEYLVDVLTVVRTASGLEDTRAFLAAIERRKSVPAEVAVLSSGAIPASAGSVAQYAALYRRGLDEMSAFLGTRKGPRL